MKNLWQPIANLTDKYAGNLLLCAPELVDLDCNPDGIGMGYWQDGPCWGYGEEGEVHAPDGGFLCGKWNMTSDMWNEVLCHPTHFIIMAGP